jgi:hypothetical protein
LTECLKQHKQVSIDCALTGRHIPSGIVGSAGVLVGELFEVAIEFDQKIAGTPSCC